MSCDPGSFRGHCGAAGDAGRPVVSGQQAGFRVPPREANRAVRPGPMVGRDRGAGKVRWHEFLWHDKWVYETLPGGKIEAGPTLGEDGSITMSGTFSARELPADEIRLPHHARAGGRPRALHVGEDRAAGASPTASGCTSSPTRRSCRGTNRVWMRPSWHGTLAGHGGGNADALPPRTGPRRSVCLACPVTAKSKRKDRAATSIASTSLSRDFEPGKPVEAEYTICVCRHARAISRARSGRCESRCGSAR